MSQPWSPYEPHPGEWTLQQAGHLLRHATFGFNPDQLQQAFADGPQKTIERLLSAPPEYPRYEQTIATLNSREATPPETAQLAIYRMLHTPYPLHDKIAFFGSQPDWLLDAGAPQPPQNDPATVLRSNYFFSPTNYRRKVKTPLEFALNIAIAFGVPLAPATLHTQLTTLGQDFKAPARPRRWLNAFTLVARSNLAAQILAKVDHFPSRQTLLDALLQNDTAPQTLAALAPLQGLDLAQALVNLPEYQLL
jgi:hypothetical protein